MRRRNNPFAWCLGELSHAGCCWTSAESQGRAHSWGPAPSLCHQPAPLLCFHWNSSHCLVPKIGKRCTGPTPEPVRSAMGAVCWEMQHPLLKDSLLSVVPALQVERRAPKHPSQIAAQLQKQPLPPDSEITMSLLLASCLELNAKG